MTLLEQVFDAPGHGLVVLVSDVPDAFGSTPVEPSPLEQPTSETKIAAASIARMMSS
jgi:hypothetical protein